MNTQTDNVVRMSHGNDQPTTVDAAGGAAQSSLQSAHSDMGLQFPSAPPPMDVEAQLKKLNVTVTIGSGDLIEGAIKLGKGKSIVIRGTVRGSVQCEGCVVLLKEGKIEGNLQAGQAWIEGEINSFNGTPAHVDVGAIHIGNSGKVTGDIVYDLITMATPNRGVRGKLESRTV